MRYLDRRTILKGLLGGAAVTVGLPPLELFMNDSGTAYAEEGASGFPTRFGLFFWGNGVHPDRWFPEKEGMEWEISEQLEALAPFMGRFSVVGGLRVAVPNVEPHHATACGILTGSPLIKHPSGDWTFSAPTIDQVIASAIGQDTRFPSLEVGTKPGIGMSYNGPNSVNPAEASPHLLFERLFGGSFLLPGDEPVFDPTVGLRRSVLDAVSSQISGIQSRVGAADKQRLQQHFDGIRTLEKRLAKLEEEPPNYAGCAYPPTPEAKYPDQEGRPQLQARNRAMCDILAMALACDQSRVFSNVFTKPLVNVLFDGVDAGHHRLTHDEPGDQPQVNRVVKQCMEALAYQIEALESVEEGDGTLLDHMVLMATTDIGIGKTHTPEDFPILLAGSANGKLKMGLNYKSPSSENATTALLSVLRAVGVDRAEFGADEGLVSDSLGAIEA